MDVNKVPQSTQAPVAASTEARERKQNKSPFSKEKKGQRSLTMPSLPTQEAQENSTSEENQLIQCQLLDSETTVNFLSRQINSNVKNSTILKKFHPQLASEKILLTDEKKLNKTA